MSSAKALSHKPITIIKSSTMSDVIRKLLDNNISRLIVQDAGRSVGIITEKDVGFFLFNETTKQGLDQVPLSKIMNPIAYVDEGQSAEGCAKVMSDNDISSLVIGSAEKSTGIITKTDLVRHYNGNYAGRRKVADHMTHRYVSTHSAAPLSKVVKKMLENRISRLIVMNQMEHPIGVVSLRDMFRISLELGSEVDDTGITLSERIRRGFLSEDGFGGIAIAGDVMTKGIISVRFNDDLAHACGIMLQNRISGVAVLDGNGGLAGILSKTDITRALAA